MAWYSDKLTADTAEQSGTHRFGATTITDGIQQPVWDHGGQYTHISAAATLYLTSSDDSDTTEVTVSGTDANGASQVAVADATGQTPVALPGTWLSATRAYVSGSVAPAGDIYFAESDTYTAGVPDTQSKVKAKIVAGNNQTLMAIYVVPAGYTFHAEGWTLGYTGGTSAEVLFNIWMQESDGVPRVHCRQRIDTPRPFSREFYHHWTAPAGARVWVTAQRTSGSGTVEVSTDFEGHIVAV